MLKIDNYCLSGRNTFRMNAGCKCFVEFDSASELEALDWDSLPAPVRTLGSGSNVLLTGDFPGTILHSAIDYIKYVDMGLDEVPVMVGSGVEWDHFVAQACSYGLWGAENLSLIPGEVGAAAVQNIGAYGVEVCDLVSGVVCYDLKERRKVKFSAAECGYAYRDSMFKHADGRFVVTSVLMRLSRKYRPRIDYKGVREALGLPDSGTPDGLTPQTVRDAIIRVRQAKLPDVGDVGSAGSYFKNPVVTALDFARIIDAARRDYGPLVTVPHYINPDGSVKIPAAWLIDRCGLKGASEGGAAVWEKQPLVIVNASGSATPADILSLEERIISRVRERFGIILQTEVEKL